MTSLESLSREAAKVLPEDFAWKKSCVISDGEILYGTRSCWLHESTEACTEIMVRVLWPAGWRVIGSKDWAEANHGPSMVMGAWNVQRFDAHNNDPMRAFRVAVLSALIALKK